MRSVDLEDLLCTADEANRTLSVTLKRGTRLRDVIIDEEGFFVGRGADGRGVPFMAVQVAYFDFCN